MSEQISLWVRARIWVRAPFAIPTFYRKYDMPQATRMSINLLRNTTAELLGERSMRLLRSSVRALWLAVGPMLLVAAAQRAMKAEAGAYAEIWKTVALCLIGLTLTLHALGVLTLRRNARSAFRPLATLPVRMLLLGILWLPVTFKLSFEQSLLFAGVTITLYLLTAPLLQQWLQLWLFQWGSPRRAGLTEALSVPLINEASIERFAAHEAGHALMYGLGEEIPEDLYAYIDPDVIGEGYGGAVLCVEEFTPDRTTLELLRFRLMVLAAGAAGEYVRLGTISLSVHHDFVSFEAIAPYFMLAAGYPIMADAKTEEQHAANAAAVAKLREEMVELAKDVIEANRSAHDKLIDQLKSKRELAYDDILPILATVSPINGAPRPAWPSTVVTHALRP